MKTLSVIVSLLALMASLFGRLAIAEPSDAFPPVRIIDQLRHYPVIGDNASQINAELSKQAGLFEATGSGNTHSRFEIDRNPLRRDGTCELASLEVRVTIITTLPQWQAEQSASDSLRRQWRGSAEILERHEAGHRENALAEAHRLRKNLLRIGSKRSCISLDAAIELELQSSMQRLDVKDVRFDDRTWNGLRDDPRSPSAATLSAQIRPRQRPHHPGRTWLYFYNQR